MTNRGIFEAIACTRVRVLLIQSRVYTRRTKMLGKCKGTAKLRVESNVFIKRLFGKKFLRHFSVRFFSNKNFFIKKFIVDPLFGPDVPQ